MKAHVLGGTVEERFNLQARHSINFAGGTLLGYDEGEFGSGLVFVPRHGMPEYFPLLNVTQFVRWNDGVLIVTSAAMSDDGMIYLARKTPDGGIQVAPYKRTDVGFCRGRVESDGSLNFYNWVRLKPDSHFARVK